MAKNKHKNNKKKPAVQKQETEKHYLFYPMKDGKLDVDWVIMPPDFGGVQAMQGSPLKFKLCESNAIKFLEKTYKDLPYERYAGKIADVKADIIKQSDFWLKSFNDLNPELNKYSEEAKNVTYDTIDFRKYLDIDGDFTDLLTEANKILQENPSVTMLWSPQEYTEIRLSNTLSYRIRRVLYDPIHISVRYCVVEYQTFKLSETETVEIPTMEFVVSPMIANFKRDNDIGISSGTLTYLNGETSPLTISRGEFADFHKTIIRCISETMEDPNDFYIMRTAIMGADSLLSEVGHMERNHNHFSNKERYKVIKGSYIEFIKDLYANEYENCSQALQVEHKLFSAGIIPAALIVVNSYLKNKQLSKPIGVADEDNITAPLRRTVSEDTEIVTERKVRRLGNSITITSAARPQYSDIERIIKYHTPEWQCRGHLRRLKSGKVIEVKPYTCKRRCVDLDKGKPTEFQKKGTDYIIEPQEQVVSAE